jgi:hypothetical protein
MFKLVNKPILLIFSLTFLLLSCSQHLPAKGKEEVKASTIIKMLDKAQNLNFNNKIISGDLDFSQVKTKVVLHYTLSQSVVNASVSFTNCKFTGKVICSGNVDGIGYQTVFMQNLIFNSCEFVGLADFQSVIVHGNVSFAGSRFADVATFNGFYSQAKASYFGQIIVEKDFSMQDALFVGSCDFFKSQFKANLSFQSSRFDGLFNFNNVTCNSRSDFSKVRFNYNSTFNYTVFEGVARFNQLRALGMSDFVQVQFKGDALFTNAIFYDNCKFNETKVFAVFDFSSTIFCSGLPIFEKIEIVDKSLVKYGSCMQQQPLIFDNLDSK